MQSTVVLNGQLFAVGVRQRSTDGWVLNPIDNLVLYVLNLSSSANNNTNDTSSSSFGFGFHNSSDIIPQVRKNIYEFSCWLNFFFKRKWNLKKGKDKKKWRWKIDFWNWKIDLNSHEFFFISKLVDSIACWGSFSWMFCYRSYWSSR